MRFAQARGSRFQLVDEDKQWVPVDTGPGNPQTLNRYSDMLNNPLRYTDPTGHCPVCLLPEIVVPLLPYIGLAVLISCVSNPYCRAAVGDFYDQWQAGAIEFRQYVAQGIASIQRTLASSGSGPEITFGHGDRHLEDTGLTTEEAEAAIREAVNEVLAKDPDAEGYWGSGHRSPYSNRVSCVATTGR